MGQPLKCEGSCGVCDLAAKECQLLQNYRKLDVANKESIRQMILVLLRTQTKPRAQLTRVK